MDFDLTSLGPSEFEHLIQSLASAELGNGVQAFGDGPDGGREATFDGPVHFPLGDGEMWNGYGIVQAKHKTHLADVGENLNWTMRSISSELSKWKPNTKNKIQRKKVPKYYLFATNVRLSPVEDSGGVDTATAHLAEQSKAIGVKGSFLWHYDSICMLLRKHPGIRQTFAGLITSGDVLTKLNGLLQSPSTAEIADDLRIHVAQELISRQWIGLGESGYEGGDRIPLSMVATDLPAILRRQFRGEEDEVEVNVIRYILEKGNSSLRPKYLSNNPFGYVVLGGPGQGKSTFGQILCQAYRAAMINTSESSLGPEADEAHRKTVDSFGRMGIPLPVMRRWPIHIILTKFADTVSGDIDPDLMQYIGSRTKVKGSRMTPNGLAAWFQAWPIALILDGLDEVPSVTARDKIRKAISDFIVEAQARQYDLLIVATTRPQGYRDEFDLFSPRTLVLRELTPVESVAYARRLISAKHSGEIEKIEDLTSRIVEASEDPATARLMRSPLQATIMTYLLEKRRRAPQTRFGLFDAYYETIYSREESKSGYLGDLLGKHRERIDYLHEQSALYLQVRAEGSGSTEAVLTTEQVRNLVISKLRFDEYGDEEVKVLSEELMRGATERVVLLVSIGSNAVGFEVRSLQEYMAARALTPEGDEDKSTEGLKILAPSAYWRNTWLLAAGRIFAKPNRRDSFIVLLRDLDHYPYPTSGVIGYGAQLAMEMLGDDIAVHQPKYQLILLRHALDLLQKWPGNEHVRFAEVLEMLPISDDRIYNEIKESISSAVKGDGASKTSATLLMHLFGKKSGRLGLVARNLLSKYPSLSSASAESAFKEVKLKDLLIERLNLGSEGDAEIPDTFSGIAMPEYDSTVSVVKAFISGEIHVAPSLNEILKDEKVKELLASAIPALELRDAGAAIWIKYALISIEGSGRVGQSPVVAAPGTGLF